ncbi:MAG: type II toxin-antitoxin system VapC family toxin [Coriobacteriales bacterium]|jgi:PIN domain nuclease of toxin-antitoxin system|nr:type II toxin-antitoxin system VapC family toxin [Coriobacteriales bacterium]
MRYLLDTHTVLWFLNDSEKLSKQATAIIEDNQTQDDIVISVASLWEFVIKHSLGKLSFAGGVANLRIMIEANSWDVIPIAQSHLERLSDLPFLHRDPFDRLLSATALSDGMTLVTADDSIHSYDVPWVW